MVTRGGWRARYPDLAGKVTLVTGDMAAIVEIVAAFASNGAPTCVVAEHRAIVDAAVEAARESPGTMGVAGAPADDQTWQRVLPHAEQRLGPVDIVVAAGGDAARAAVISAALPDMAARRRGVVIEVGTDLSRTTPAHGVRRRYVEVGPNAAAGDVAAMVALCASDVLSAPSVAMRVDR